MCFLIILSKKTWLVIKPMNFSKKYTSFSVRFPFYQMTRNEVLAYFRAHAATIFGVLDKLVPPSPLKQNYLPGADDLLMSARSTARPLSFS